jgi:hypothetical protein
MPAQLTRKNHSTIGLLLCKKYPELARDLLSEYLSIQQAQQADVTDTSLVSYYFQAYCDIRGIPREELTRTNWSHDISRSKQEFVGLILRIYHPYLFKNPQSYFCPQHGLVKNLAATMCIQKGHASMLVSKARTAIRVYDSFAESIESIYNQIFTQVWH